MLPLACHLSRVVSVEFSWREDSNNSYWRSITARILRVASKRRPMGTQFAPHVPSARTKSSRSAVEALEVGGTRDPVAMDASTRFHGTAPCRMELVLSRE